MRSLGRIEAEMQTDVSVRVEDISCHSLRAECERTHKSEGTIALVLKICF